MRQQERMPFHQPTLNLHGVVLDWSPSTHSKFSVESRNRLHHLHHERPLLIRLHHLTRLALRSILQLFGMQIRKCASSYLLITLSKPPTSPYRPQNRTKCFGLKLQYLNPKTRIRRKLSAEEKNKQTVFERLSRANTSSCSRSAKYMIKSTVHTARNSTASEIKGEYRDWSITSKFGTASHCRRNDSNAEYADR